MAKRKKSKLAPKVRARLIAKENARRMREWESYTPIATKVGRPLGYEQRKYDWNKSKNVRRRMLEIEKAGLQDKSPAYQNIKKYAIDRRDPIWNVTDITDKTGAVTGVRITPLTEHQMEKKFDEIRRARGYEEARKFRTHYYDVMEGLLDNETLSVAGTNAIQDKRYQTFKENYGDLFGHDLSRDEYEKFWQNVRRALDSKDDHYGSSTVVSILNRKDISIEDLMNDPSLFDEVFEMSYNQATLNDPDIAARAKRFEQMSFGNEELGLNRHGRRIR